MMRRTGQFLLLVASAILIPLGAQAQQPLKIVVPFTAGSGSDVVARLVGNELSGRINQPVVIVNQTGGSGIVATQGVQNAEPDGNTLLLTTTNHVLLPATMRSLPFDVIEDFAPVLQISTGPLVIAANADFPAKTIPDLIALAKAKPGTINYATPGVGTVPHLAIELFGHMTGAKMVAVPYRGGSQAITDVVAGVVSFYPGTFASVIPALESKKAFALAITSRTRPSFIKDVPTIAEQGVSDYNVEYWYGFVAPAKTPPARVRQLRDEIAAIVNSPKVRDALMQQGFEPKATSSSEFGAYLRSELKLWSQVAASAGIKPQ